LEYIVTFRADINGLRAIAVIAVVIFHFNNEWLSGGFAGVDVFFVISGFLMTGIIFKGLDTESFSVLRFYIARANRIII
jgi:peptidoglycan/LPS O-acetylase OafA/YrhL